MASVTYQHVGDHIVPGLIAGIIAEFSIIGMGRLKIDDPVDAISVHDVNGLLGLLLPVLHLS